MIHGQWLVKTYCLGSSSSYASWLLYNSFNCWLQDHLLLLKTILTPFVPLCDLHLFFKRMPNGVGFHPVPSPRVLLPWSSSICGWYSWSVPLSFEPCSEGCGYLRLHSRVTRLAVQDALWICFLMRSSVQRSSKNIPIVTLPLSWLFSTLKPVNLFKWKSYHATFE